MFLQLAVIKERLGAYARLTRLHRPIGILLLLWPMLWALWLAAEGVPSPQVLLIFVLGTVLMRSAGCVINDYADRDFDGHVERTRERPIATGEVGEKEALRLFVALLFPAALLVLMTNRLTILLAVVAVTLAVSYPFAKRHTYVPQLVLGAAFGWAVPMAFAAEINAVPPLAWLVFCAACLWALIYDTEYAMVDRDDDIRLGLKSTAILFDDNDRLILGVVMILMLVNLLFIGQQAALRWPFHLALAVASVLFGYQQYLISAREREGCFAAFLNNNWVGGVIFAGIASSYLLPPLE